MVDRAVDEASTRAEEYYDAFVETGGNPNEFMPVEITIDYEIKYYQDNFVSFLIEKTETLASAYQEYMYYNINLNTGKILTLKDLLGDNYQDVITQEIRKQISAYPEEERSLFFEEVNIKDFINQDRIFYINQDKRIVIKFQKYEIAAGAAGPVEFVIPQNISL
ncbi:MAG: RsiV family protein [Coprobacillus cateniformis]